MRVADAGPGAIERVASAWAALAGLSGLRGLAVVVRRESMLCPRGWVGVLRIGEWITAVVPTEDLVSPVTDALADVPATEATSPALFAGFVPEIVEVLGPAWLSYPVGPLSSGKVRTDGIERLPPSALHEFIGRSDRAELDESALASVTSSVSVIRDQGEVLAASGYQLWPESIAHISVMTRSDHRGRGLAQAVAADAVDRAASAGLLPQWRARPPASRAVAKAIGLREIGAQLSLRVATT